MVTLITNVSFFIYVVYFLEPLNDEEFLLVANLTDFVAWFIFVAFFHEGPTDIWGGIQVVFPNVC